MGDKEAEPTLADVMREVRGVFEGVGKEVASAFDKWQDEAQYRFDKELGKQLSKHPELYAELKRTYRQVRKGLDKTAREWGLR